MKGSITMDQNKILWIVAAVGAFLLVVLGAALIFYTPKPSTGPQIQNLDGLWTSSRDTYQGQNTIGLTSSTNDYTNPNPGTMPYSENPIYDNQQDNAQGIQIVQGTEHNQDPALGTGQVLKDGQSLETLNLYAQNANLYAEQTTIDLNNLSRVQTPAPSQVQSNQQTNIRDLNASAQTNAPVNTSQVAKTNVGGNQVAKTTAPVNTKPVTPTTQAAKPSTTNTKTIAPIENKFWIQASSFASKINAEELKAALTKENFVSEIFTFTDAKNTLFYRVRIGPYTTKSEAEYWQGQLASLASLKGVETYITNTSLKK